VLLTGFSVLPLVLKVDSEATIEIETARISRVNRARIEYFGAFSFHHAIISNSLSKLVSFSASEKYSSISDFRGSEIFFTHIRSFKPALVSLIVELLALEVWLSF
jgi:hypothetical protein